MTKYFLIRHGETDYSPIDEKGFIGQARSFAPLTTRGIEQLKETSNDPRLRESDIIISSPYTRALQSAAILSKELSISINVEVDLHEWVPDIVDFNYKTSEDCFALAKDFELHNGVHPIGEKKVWETYKSMKKRMDKVLEKYMRYDTVIVVCHGMVIRTQKDQEVIRNGEIIEIIK